MTKEDKIIKILQKNLQLDMPYAEQAERDTAKEIADLDAEESVQFAKVLHSHYMKFIDWLFSKDSKYAIAYGSDKPLCTTYEDFTIEEVYLHWCVLPEKKNKEK